MKSPHTYLQHTRNIILTMMAMLLLTSQLTACGFHLRGIQKMPPTFQRLYIQTNQPNSYFIKQLTYELVRNHVSLANDPATATATLQVSPVKMSSTLVSLTGNAEAGQYLIKASVQISVFDNAGKTIITQTTLSKSNTLSSNATQRLGANIQEKSITKQLKDKLAEQIITIMANSADASHENQP